MNNLKKNYENTANAYVGVHDKNTKRKGDGQFIKS